MSYQLPVQKIIVGALFLAWGRKETYLRAISFPTLILVSIWALSNYVASSESQPLYFLIMVLWGIGFSFFAVTCHRLILIGTDDVYSSFNFRLRIREVKFLGWILIVYTIVTLAEMVPMTITMNLNGSYGTENSSEEFYWLSQIFKIPALYVLGRLCLVFPATAVDGKAGLKWSWLITKGNGWRVFVIVGLVPWIFSWLVWLVWREEATLVEQVLLTLVTYIGLAVEIFMLSLTYKELSSEQYKLE
ncbi:MAG: hypothetical protein GY702_13510 [Desulfobulbaceae bacterium]|nr:hypothetical protein [Desulfobulbaceae bacterium]